jgi:ribonuclease HII
VRYIIGIDEVGRGSLAGPVAVAAVAVSKELKIRNYELGKLRDSKKLSAKQWEWLWSA